MEDIEKIKGQIELARKHALWVFRARQNVVRLLTGMGGYVVEFPEPDTMHVYTDLFGEGHKVGTPTTYRLSFGKKLKWVGISHPWGKPGDIEVE